jgi:hypothetical protein
MSLEQDRVRILAERVAGRIAQNAGSTGAGGKHVGPDIAADIAALRSGISEIQKRLSHIESHIQHTDCSDFDRQHIHGSLPEGDTQPTPSLWQTSATSWHPSQQKFGVQEAAVSELVDFLQSEKKCELEPGGKPCDHCSMCSSRGF